MPLQRNHEFTPLDKTQPNVIFLKPQYLLREPTNWYDLYTTVGFTASTEEREYGLPTLRDTNRTRTYRSLLTMGNIASHGVVKRNIARALQIH